MSNDQLNEAKPEAYRVTETPSPSAARQMRFIANGFFERAERLLRKKYWQANDCLKLLVKSPWQAYIINFPKKVRKNAARSCVIDWHFDANDRKHRRVC